MMAFVLFLYTGVQSAAQLNRAIFKLIYQTTDLSKMDLKIERYIR